MIVSAISRCVLLLTSLVYSYLYMDTKALTSRSQEARVDLRHDKFRESHDIKRPGEGWRDMNDF